MRSDRQKEARRRYEQSDKGKAAKKRQEETYKASGGRAKAESNRLTKPLSEARKAAKARWAKRNQAYFTADRALRRSLERNLSDFDKFVLIEAVSLARLREQVIGGKWHVDHVIPVSKGGNNAFNNIQVVPASWNQSKSNKHSQRYLGN